MGTPLQDFDPRWIGLFSNAVITPTPHFIIGLSFNCPHCIQQRLVAWFKQPIDPDNWLPRMSGMETFLGTGTRWDRTGETFETLSLTPSIDASTHGHWHGFITNGVCT